MRKWIEILEVNKCSSVWSDKNNCWKTTNQLLPFKHPESSVINRVVFQLCQQFRKQADQLDEAAAVGARTRSVRSHSQCFHDPMCDYMTIWCWMIMSRRKQSNPKPLLQKSKWCPSKWNLVGVAMYSSYYTYIILSGTKGIIHIAAQWPTYAFTF